MTRAVLPLVVMACVALAGCDRALLDPAVRDGGRTMVIVTRQRDYSVPGAIVVHSLEEALGVSASDNEVFVIGGAELFRETLPRADRLHLTIVDAAPEGDTYMPEIDWSAWQETTSRSSPADERNPLAFRYAMYERAPA